MMRRDPFANDAAPFISKLIEIRAASADAAGRAALIDFLSQKSSNLQWLRALGDGLRRAGSSIERADSAHKFSAVFAKAAGTVRDAKASDVARLLALSTGRGHKRPERSIMSSNSRSAMALV